jgi:hypothetical protein
LAASALAILQLLGSRIRLAHLRSRLPHSARSLILLVHSARIRLAHSAHSRSRLPHRWSVHSLERSPHLTLPHRWSVHSRSAHLADLTGELTLPHCRMNRSSAHLRSTPRNRGCLAPMPLSVSCTGAFHPASPSFIPCAVHTPPPSAAALQW